MAQWLRGAAYEALGLLIDFNSLKSCYYVFVTLKMTGSCRKVLIKF